MAHLDDNPEAVDAPVTDTDSAAAAISALGLGGDAEEQEESETEGEAEPEGDDELDVEEQDDEESGSETTTAAPASLTAEEKAKFAQLPKEAQQLLNDVETRRNAQVQQATTKASEAQRTAEASAAQADAQARKVYAAQLRTVIKAFAPPAPDPMLAQTDPMRFIAEDAQHKAATAQLDEFEQQVTAMDQEADGQISEAFIAERDRYLSTLPEVQNPDTRQEFVQKAMAAATELGLDQAALNQATGPEWQKLRLIHDWKTDAEKYRAALSRQMQRVRDGKKPKPNRPNAQQAQGERRGFREATAKAKDSGSVDDAAAAIRALG